MGIKKSVLAIAFSVNFILLGCVSNISDNEINLMKDIESSTVSNTHNYDMNDKENSMHIRITQFSLSIFKESFESDKNTLISPFSIINALGMIANGAKNETLAQIEAAFTSDIQNVNEYLKAYLEYLPHSNEYKVSLANSIWFKNAKNLTVYEDFLQTSKNYYDASIYKTPFNTGTKDDINNWIKDATDGQIEGVLQNAPSPTTIMYLVNALSFDAEWRKIYEADQVRDGTFTLANGEKQEAEFMYSDEYLYLEIEGATGFIKSYKDDTYAFVALLPDEDMLLIDFANSLDASELVALLENPKKTKVSASIPKFSNEYSVSLNEILKKLGMTNAFDADTADFSGLGASTVGNIYIDNISHHAKIDVDEKGTKAGAVTIALPQAASIEPKPKSVQLDRPFLYMVIDRKQNLPLFMGTVVDMQKG